MKFYQINFNDSLYLTSDGTISGKPCKLNVAGVSRLILTRTGSTSPAIDGTPITQLVEQNGKGFPIEISIQTLTKGVFDDLVTLINSSLESSTTIEINGTGDTGDFTKNVVPVLPEPISFSGFRNNYIQGVILRFLTA